MESHGLCCDLVDGTGSGSTNTCDPDAGQPTLFEMFTPGLCQNQKNDDPNFASDVEVLSLNQLFKGIPRDEIIKERSVMEPCHFAPGQIISCEGCEDERFHVITRGKVEFLVSDGKGGEICVGQGSPGGFFGELALLSHQSSGVRIRASQDVATLALSEGEFRAFIGRHPNVAFDVLSDIAPRLSHMDHMLRENVSKNVATEFERQKTWKDKLEDRWAAYISSRTFILGQAALVAGWMVWNLIPGLPHFDPNPFILLNLVFAAQAAFGGLIIMRSQDRQSSYDRIGAQVNHEVTRKSELLTEMILNKLNDFQRQLNERPKTQSP